MNLKTVSYGTNEYHQLDLYIPQTASSKTPLIVFIHGGAWWSEDKKDHVELLENIAHHGFAAACINYRIRPRDAPASIPPVRHPAHVEDAHAALEFLRHLPSSGSYCYDPSRIYVVGHSAGAHMAMMLLLDPIFESHIKGVVGICGLYDLKTLVNTFPSYCTFVSQAFGDDQHTYYDASPVSKRPKQPVAASVLLVHSLEDELVDAVQSHLMLDHLREQGVDVAIDLSVDGKHDQICKSPKLFQALVDFVERKEQTKQPSS